MIVTVSGVPCEIPMHALPERGTWRGFTDEELRRLGVSEMTMRGFMQLVLMYLCLPDSTATFYPVEGGERHAD